MTNISFSRSHTITLRRWVAMLLIGLAFVATPAKSAVTYTGTGPGNDAGETNKASVTFSLSVSGTTTNLLVTLTNLATYKPNNSPDILSAVFFSLAGNPTLTKVSGVLSVGSVAVEDGSNVTVPGGVVGGSWAYAAGLSGAPGSANEGIGAAGFATDDGSQYNGGLSGRPFIKDSAVFKLGAVPASFTLSGITNVNFQYGSALVGEPNVPGVLVPEPSAVALTGCGLLLLGLLQRNRRYAAVIVTAPIS